MAKIQLSLEERKALFLYRTSIENLFINEFMPDAPGDYVKVYLIGLMCAEYAQDMDSRRLGVRLGLSEDEIEEAWIYWESRGLVRKRKQTDERGDEVFYIEFISQVEALYGRMMDGGDAAAEAAGEAGAAESEVEAGGYGEGAGTYGGAGGYGEAAGGYSAAASAGPDGYDEGAADGFAGEAPVDVPLYVNIDDMDFDDMIQDKLVDRRLRDIYTKYQEVCGRTVSRRDTGRIEDAIRVYGIEPDIFEFAIDYCADLEKYSIDYIFKVALRWKEDGCTTIAQAKALIEKHSLRSSWYGKVFKALGFNRLPAPADREMMDRWFDDMGCGIGEVLDACSATAGIREPSLRYVNKVLENRRLEKGGIRVRPVYAQQAGSPAGASAGASGAADSASAEASGGASPVSRKVLADYFEYIRNESEKEQKKRTREVLDAIPEMKAVFERESAINAKMLSMKPGSESLDERQSLRVERHQAESEKKLLLEAGGFPADYLKRQYRCGICRDTGYTDEGMVCSCCRERAQEAYDWINGKAAEE